MQISVKTVIRDSINYWIHIIFVPNSGHTFLNQIEKLPFYIFKLCPHLHKSIHFYCLSP